MLLQLFLCAFILVSPTVKEKHAVRSTRQVSASVESSESPIVVNDVKTASFMLAWPSITTFTLVKGWRNDTTTRLKDSVKEVVKSNPILSGRAQMSGLFNTKISIVPGKYSADFHDFVEEIIPESFAESDRLAHLQESNETEILDFMDEFIAPLVPKADSVIESIQSGAPLFGVHIIRLLPHYACYVIRMSHCVGDGVTYYNIIDQINDKFNNRDTKKFLLWGQTQHHEIFPDTFSDGDITKYFGWPFVLGLLRNFYNIKKAEKNYLILDKKKILRMRKSLRASESPYLSSNDIITASLCEACKSSSIFAFTMDTRDQRSHFGGNFHVEIPFLKAAAEDPNGFRRIVKNRRFFDPDSLPLCPFVVGRVGRISSLATIQKLIENDETEIICHAMLSSFVQNVPLDVAFITSMNKNSYCILHNFRDINTRDGLLNDILANHYTE